MRWGVGRGLGVGACYLGLWLALACQDRDADSQSAPSPTEMPAKSARAASTSPPEEAQSSPGSTGDQLVDLVHHTTARVISSSHRDAKSRVEFLVDDIQQSAWRPNPPDPAPWVEVQLAVPAPIHQATVELAGDLASADLLRVESPQLGVATWRDGSYQFSLSRPVRTNAVRINVVGKKHTRRPGEVVALSELRLLGKIPKAAILDYALPEGRAHRSSPLSSVNNAKFRSWWRAAPYESPDALCAAYEKTMGLPKVEDIPGGRKFAYCYVPSEALVVEGVVPNGVRSVHSGWIGLSEIDEVNGGVTVGLLILRTGAGWSPANLWGENSAYDGMCPGMHVERASVTRTFFEGNVVAQERIRIYYPPTGVYQDDEKRAPAAVRSLIRCETKDRLTCREHVLAYGTPDLVEPEGTQPYPVAPQTWAWQRSYTVADIGWLRMSPCRANEDAVNEGAAKIVPCFAPEEAHLP